MTDIDPPEFHTRGVVHNRPVTAPVNTPVPGVDLNRPPSVTTDMAQRVIITHLIPAPETPRFDPKQVARLDALKSSPLWLHPPGQRGAADHLPDDGVWEAALALETAGLLARHDPPHPRQPTETRVRFALTPAGQQALSLVLLAEEMTYAGDDPELL